MYRTIVVGTDGSKGAIAALRRAAEVAVASGAGDVHVVTACEPYAMIDIEELRRALPREYHQLVDPHMPATDRFNEAFDVLAEYGVRAINHEMGGGAAAALLDVAEEVEADLIVVGARGLGAISRFLRGSVSTRVVHHSPCDVLVVEHPEEAATAEPAA